MGGMRYQPQGRVRLNAAHPLAAGLAEVLLPGVTSRSILTGADSSTQMRGFFEGSPKGLGFRCTGLPQRMSTTLWNGQPAAWLVVAYRTTRSSNVSIVRKDGTVSPMQEWDGLVRAGFFDSSGAYLTVANYGAAADFAGKVSTFAGVLSSAEKGVFANGGPTVPAVTSITVAGGRSNPFVIGAAENNNEVADNWSVLAVFAWQGARVPSLAQLRDLERNPWQLFVDDADHDGLSSVVADVALSGAAAAVGSAFGSLTTSIRMAGASSSAAAGTAALSTQVRLTGAALAESSAAGSLETSVRLVGAAAAGAAASGMLVTSISLTGVAAAVASAVGTLAVGGSGLSGAAQAIAGGAGALTTGLPLSGTAMTRAVATGQLAGAAVALSGAGVATATASGQLSTAILLVGFASSTGFGAGELATSINLAGAAGAGASAGGALTVGVVYARAPAGPGYRPQQHFNECRPAATSSRRPAALQRNNR